ncbi:hypothetical protein ACFFX0_25210 [Citricoccus parietis]|uniref:Uncharacterized protein n=1 Tax=Citricoccus parietis TaxID=592307 RepID=A0ABV5G5U0_9MICC
MDNRPHGDRPPGGTAGDCRGRRRHRIQGQGVFGPTALTGNAVRDDGTSTLQAGRHPTELLGGAVRARLRIQAEVPGSGLPAAEVDRRGARVQGNQCHEGQQAVVAVAQMLPIVGDQQGIGRTHQRHSWAPPFQCEAAVTSSAPGCPGPRRRHRGRHVAHGQRRSGAPQWHPRGPPPQRHR